MQVKLLLIDITISLIRYALGFTTRGLADDLALATLYYHYVFSDLKFGPLCSEIATVKVVIPNGLKPILLLATAWSLYQAEIHLI